MKVLFVNSYYGRLSTGNIVKTLRDYMEKKGDQTFVAYGFFFSGEKDTLKLIPGKTRFAIYKRMLLSRITGYNGFSNRSGTKKLIRYIEYIKPDIINIHILHADYLDSHFLLMYLKHKRIPVLFTMHDCWNFTGLCPHFAEFPCFDWRQRCTRCRFINRLNYPKTWFFDRTKEQFDLKKEMFSDAPNFYFTGPCKWICQLASESSILKGKSFFPIYNGINYNVDGTITSVQNPFFGQRKKVVLGINSTWSRQKGIEGFLALSEILPPDYQIVLVGKCNSSIKKKFLNICFIERTNKPSDLMSFYKNAYVFLNLSIADTFPTTNLEALQCGCPIIMYKTGGGPELAKDGCVYVCEKNSPESVVELLPKIHGIDRQVVRDYGSKFSAEQMSENYHKLFCSLALASRERK